MLEYPGTLHAHTHFSNIKFRDSINRPEELIDYAIELGHNTLAITEHDCICGAVKVEKYYNQIKKNYPDFKIIQGNEIYLTRNELSLDNIQAGERFWHFILLAKDREGFRQICELSTRAWMRSFVYKGLRRIPTYYSDLEEIVGRNPGHLVASTACIGGCLGGQLLNYRELKIAQSPQMYDLYNQIQNWCRYLQNMFGKDNFYLELQPSASGEQEYVNKEILKLSTLLNIPYIITLDAHYLKKEDAPIHKAFLNAQSADRETSDFYATTYMMNTEELESYLTYMTREELNIAYHNILEIRNKCEDYSILKDLKIPSLRWKIPELEVIPQFYLEKIPTLKTFLNSSFGGDEILARAIVERIIKDKTLQNEETYKEVEEELQITWQSSEVNKAHWSAYFLNLQGIIDTVWEAGSIVGPGRGSGVGFLLLYILDITQINPLRETTKTFNWRFLNPERESVLDVDFDISGLKRSQVLEAFREKYGRDRVANVATFAQEKSKSAILTAARGLGIDVDDAQYIASLIPSDRGITRTLKQCYYGDDENDFKPINEFVKLMNSEEFSELWAVAQRIEGLICRMGIHAGGVIFVDEDFSNSTALMRAPDGTIITQFDLHDSEAVSLIKYDALSVEGMDRIQICIELLQREGLIDPALPLKEAYEQTIGIYNLERENKEMWKMVWSHKILSLFQMEQQSGVQGIALSKPESVDDLATLNSAIRLMAQEKGAETPLEKFARFKKDISLWYKEMDLYGLTREEQKILEPIVKISYGLCISQEAFMQLVQIPECGGFDLNWADKLRKAIAKKNPAAYDKLEKEYFKVTAEKGCSSRLCSYVWRVLIAMNRGYGFNASHTLAYSLIGLQEMNLAFKYPIIFWNCANLIVDSGALEIKDSEKDTQTDYAKVATAINKILEAGIKVSLVNINSSDLTFVPDVKNNRILYGLKAIGHINDEIIKDIQNKREFSGIKDFMKRCPLGKKAMINLIKAGAFDEIEDKQLGNRKAIMAYYLLNNCDAKTKLTLQNFNGLIGAGLVPKELEFQVRIFNFNKYLKAHRKIGQYFTFDDSCIQFFDRFLLEESDKLEAINNIVCIKRDTWDKIYQKCMDRVRDWLKENQKSILAEYNWYLFNQMWQKYALGTESHWEMESVCFYSSPHELASINNLKYGIKNFNELIDSEVNYYYRRGKFQMPVYNLYRIAGTVLAKNDSKTFITLLTTSGVVNVKFSREQYAKYKSQLSTPQPDGTKKITSQSWFKRGTLLVVTGYRKGDMFMCKTYKNKDLEEIHSVYKIIEVTGSDIILTSTREGTIVDAEDEE